MMRRSRLLSMSIPDQRWQNRSGRLLQTRSPRRNRDSEAGASWDPPRITFYAGQLLIRAEAEVLDEMTAPEGDRAIARI